MKYVLNWADGLYNQERLGITTLQHYNEELVVSFHEDNIRGIAKSNSLIKNKSNRLVPVFADSYGSINKENGNVSLNVFVQRGMRVLPLSMIGFCINHFCTVTKSDR